MSVQLKKGVLDLCVLSILAKQDTYGYDIYQSINNILGISESTIYPILRKMVSESLLETRLRESPDGPARKYFTMTPLGKRRYVALKEAWQAFVSRVDGLIEEEEATS
ncbi:MAG: PadR family transcriptional regulator [Acholeplasmatales bacterium]|nr:MAG: PadR family transcriptional regulator [Acholeplasmatales bacterium]